MLRQAERWTITVHRELEDLVAAWMRRSDPADTVGLLHIGFDRPPSHEFDGVAAGREGRLLLTTSAKHGLPTTFGASEGELARVGSLGVYLGTRGWGYVVEDSELPQRPSVSTASGRPSGWLNSFVTDHPEALEALHQAAILDDTDYLAHEALLPKGLRKALGVYRLECLIEGDRSDPCAVARAAPPWLLNRAFEALSPSVRVSNVFKNLGIRTIADLAEQSLDTLLGTANFGRKSARDLLSLLERALDEGPQSGDRLTSTLIESVRRSLSKYDDRSRDIMLRRMGLGHPPEILQELGIRYKVSRERIRQVEAKVIHRLIREEVWDDLLRQKINDLLRSRRIPLPLKGIDAADPWFSGVGVEGHVLRYLLLNVSQGPAKIVRIDEIEYIGLLDQVTWDNAVVEARRYLEGLAGQGWTEGHCRAGVDAILPESCSEFRDLLWSNASRYGQFVSDKTGRTLVSYGRGAETFVQAVLTASDRPLHFSEIAARAAALTGQEFDPQRAHHAAASIGYLMGRGVYGLDRHIKTSAEELATLAERAADVVFEGEAGRQWHANELVAELVDRGVAIESLDKYELDIALRKAGQLERLGRFVWHDVRSPSADVNRIDIRQAVIAALQDAGQPLTADEIRDRVRQVRGVNGSFQIHSGDPLIRLGPSIWGLNDRDISVKRSDQPTLRRTWVEILTSLGVGIHESELVEYPEFTVLGLTVPAFISLAVADNQLRISAGRFLYLVEWGGPRRESITDVVRSIVSSATEPLTFSEISAAVRTRVRRDFPNSAISTCLQALGGHHDPVSGTWTFLRVQSDDLEDEVPETFD